MTIEVNVPMLTASMLVLVTMMTVRMLAIMTDSYGVDDARQ